MERTFEPFEGNRQLLQEGIDAIQASPLPFEEEAFDMGTWHVDTGCGTIACFAGWGWHLTRAKDSGGGDFPNVANAAANWANRVTTDSQGTVPLMWKGD